MEQKYKDNDFSLQPIPHYVTFNAVFNRHYFFKKKGHVASIIQQGQGYVKMLLRNQNLYC